MAASEPTQPADPGAPVMVGSFGDTMAAELARLHLAEAGIEAKLLDANLLQYDPLVDVAVGGVKLVVRCGDAPAAAQLLARLREQAKVLKCPECGSTEIESKQGARRAAWLSILFLGLPIGRARGRNACRACKYAWDA